MQHEPRFGGGSHSWPLPELRIYETSPTATVVRNSGDGKLEMTIFLVTGADGSLVTTAVTVASIFIRVSGVEDQFALMDFDGVTSSVPGLPGTPPGLHGDL